MSPIEVPVPPDYFVAAARVRIVCPIHLAEVRALLRMSPEDRAVVEQRAAFPVTLGDYCCDAPRTHAWWENAPDDLEHFIGYQPTASERAKVTALGLAIADAAPSDGDVAHWNYRLWCQRPTCNYAWKAREAWLRTLDDLLDESLERGQTEIVLAEQGWSERGPGVMTEFTALTEMSAVARHVW